MRTLVCLPRAIAERSATVTTGSPRHETQKGGSVKKTTASDLTLITGIGRVPLTRTQVASWQRRTTGESRPGERSFNR